MPVSPTPPPHFGADPFDAPVLDRIAQPLADALAARFGLRPAETARALLDASVATLAIAALLAWLRGVGGGAFQAALLLLPLMGVAVLHWRAEASRAPPAPGAPPPMRRKAVVDRCFALGGTAFLLLPAAPAPKADQGLGSAFLLCLSLYTAGLYIGSCADRPAPPGRGGPPPPRPG